MLLEKMDELGYTLDVSTLSLLINSIAAGSLDTAMSTLIRKLVPDELMDSPSYSA